MSIGLKVDKFPDNWTQSNLGAHIEIVMGQAPPGSECNKKGVGTPFVKAGEFGRDRPQIREWTTKPLRMAKESDVLLCVVGATCGKVNRGADCAIGRSVAALRPRETINGDFLYHFMCLKTMEMRTSSRGSAQGVISKTDLSELLIPIPHLTEQAMIVEILEEQLSRLDAALASVRTAREKAARLRRSLLHAAFTGALTGHDTSEGTLPEGWRRGTLEQVARVVAGRTPTKFEQRLESSMAENRNVPFYKVGDMNSAAQFLKEARVYFAESEASTFGVEILPSGTVIFPKAGGAIATNKKRVLEVPGAIDLNCMGVCTNGSLLPKLLFWFFESLNLTTIADGSVLPQIGKRRVASIEICYPESELEQLKLLDEIDSSISRSDSVERTSEAIEVKALALRRSLLHAAFSGDLTKEWREGARV